MDFGRLYLRMKHKNEALINFQAAYNIFLSYFGKSSIPVSNSSFQIAKIMEQSNRLTEGLKYAQVAYEGYNKNNSPTSDYTILSLWAVITISFALKSDKTGEYCSTMYGMLFTRENYENPNDSYNQLQSGKFVLNC